MQTMVAFDGIIEWTLSPLQKRLSDSDNIRHLSFEKPQPLHLQDKYPNFAKTHRRKTVEW